LYSHQDQGNSFFLRDNDDEEYSNVHPAPLADVTGEPRRVRPLVWRRLFSGHPQGVTAKAEAPKRRLANPSL
jgi:hypothetical protein